MVAEECDEDVYYQCDFGQGEALKCTSETLCEHAPQGENVLVIRFNQDGDNFYYAGIAAGCSGGENLCTTPIGSVEEVYNAIILLQNELCTGSDMQGYDVTLLGCGANANITGYYYVQFVTEVEAYSYVEAFKSKRPLWIHAEQVSDNNYQVTISNQEGI